MHPLCLSLRSSSEHVESHGHELAKASELWGLVLTVFAVSLLSVSFPAASERMRFLRIPRILFFMGKHFGTGVILSTAFVHLLQESFKIFNDPCLENLWNLAAYKYKTWPGLIVLGALLIIFLVEYVSTAYVERLAMRPGTPKGTLTPVEEPYRDDPEAPAVPQDTESISEESHDTYFEGFVHCHDHAGTPHLRKATSQIISVLVLQLGIMIHSLVMGVTLALTGGSQATTLFIAVIFHQIFEGLSLGIRISGLPTATIPRVRFLPVVLCLLFAFTIPLGVLVAHFCLRGHSALETKFISGVMSAVSAGMLIYAGCVELLAGDFINDHEMRKSSLKRQFCAIVCLILGAVAMAMIGH